MRRTKTIFGLAAFVLAGAAAWQIATWEIAKTNLQDDLRDMGAQAGTHIGVVAPNSDDESRCYSQSQRTWRRAESCIDYSASHRLRGEDYLLPCRRLHCASESGAVFVPATFHSFE
jgi:hypothetical protein